MKVNNKKRALALWVLGLTVPAALITTVAVACNDPAENQQQDPKQKTSTQAAINLEEIKNANLSTILNNAKTYEDRQQLNDSNDLIFQFADRNKPMTKGTGFYQMNFRLTNGNNKKVAVVLAPKGVEKNNSNVVLSTVETVQGEEATVKFNNLSATQDYTVVGLVVFDNNNALDLTSNVQIPVKQSNVSKKFADDLAEEEEEARHQHDEPIVSQKATINSEATLEGKILKQTQVDIPYLEDAFREVANNNFVLTYSLTYRNNLYTRAYIVEEGETDLTKALVSDVVKIEKTIANVMFKNVNPDKKYKIVKIEVFNNKDRSEVVQTINADELSALSSVKRNPNLGNDNISWVIINEPEKTLYNFSDASRRWVQLRFRLKNPKKFIGKRLYSVITTTKRENLHTDYKDLAAIIYNNWESGYDKVDEYGIARVSFSTGITFKKEYFVHQLKVNDEDSTKLGFDGFFHQRVITPPHKLDGFNEANTTVFDPNDDIFDKTKNSNTSTKFENLGPLAFDNTVWNYSRKLAKVPATLDYNKNLGIGQPGHYYTDVKFIRKNDNVSLQQIENLDEDTYVEFVVRDQDAPHRTIRSRKTKITKDGKAHVIFNYKDDPNDDQYGQDYVELYKKYDIIEINYYRAIPTDDDSEEEYTYQKLNVDVPIPYNNNTLDTYIHSLTR